MLRRYLADTNESSVLGRLAARDASAGSESPWEFDGPRKSPLEEEASNEGKEQQAQGQDQRNPNVENWYPMESTSGDGDAIGASSHMSMARTR